LLQGNEKQIYAAVYLMARSQIAHLQLCLLLVFKPTPRTYPVAGSSRGSIANGKTHIDISQIQTNNYIELYEIFGFRVKPRK
jgi:hypothetical protein